MYVQINLTGNLVTDPELRYTPGGRPVATMRVAVNNRIQNRATGEWHDTPPTYLTVVAWRRLAQNVAASAHKGDEVMITGRLSQCDYRTTDGDKRTAYELEADAIGMSLTWVTAHVTKTTDPTSD